MRGLLLLAMVASLAGLTGCPSRGSYACTDSVQCVLAGVQGTCEPEGFCAFPDPECPGGRRFGTDSQGDLAGTCVTVDAAVPDAPAPCGAYGEACCSSGAACVAGASCVSDVCRTCVADVAFGRHFSCVRKTDGSVHCIGENTDGQIGNAFSGAPVTAWTAVRDSTTSTTITDAIAIAAGGQSACAIRTGGAVWCWGDNAQGMVGNNSTMDAVAAVRVVDTNDQPLTGITALDMDRHNVCALGPSGGVWCWGRNVEGQVGDGTTVTPVRRATRVLDAPAGAPITNVVELAVGDFVTCARKQDDSVWCWGRNSNGAVGDGMGSAMTPNNRPNPVTIGSATAVSAGTYERACMVRADSTMACWGQTWRGRLGNGLTNNETPSFVNAPTTVLTTRGGPALSGVSKLVAAGASCALMTDTSVKCWGDNVHGVIGSGIGSPFPVPVVFADGTPITGIDRLVANFAHVCARDENGTFLCWGRNNHGELGDFASINRSFPAPLTFTCP